MSIMNPYLYFWVGLSQPSVPTELDFGHALDTEGLIIGEKQLGSLGCGLIT